MRGVDALDFLDRSKHFSLGSGWICRVTSFSHLSSNLDIDHYSVAILIIDYEDISKGSQESMPIDVSFSRLLATLPSVELDQTGVTGVCT